MKQLTAKEISAILAVAGDADAGAHAECYSTEKEGEQVLKAFESGMEKLREMLERKRSRK